MKKSFAIFVSGVLSFAMLTGCGSASGNSASTGANKQVASSTAKNTAASKAAGTVSSKDAAGKVQIEFWHAMGSSNGELMQKIVDAYNQSQSKVFVKAVQQGSYTDAAAKMQAALAAGEAPVIGQMEIGALGVFADAGQLVDLQKFVDAEKFDMSDYMSGLLDASYYKGALIALPHSRSVPVLYYNKDRFKAAGLDENKPPITWDDLKNDAAKLSKDGTFGYSCPLDQWYYTALVMNAGGTIFNESENAIGFNGDSGTKPLQLWKDMIAAKTMHVPSGQDYNSSEACRNAFASETACMIMQSSAQLKGLEKACKFKVGAGPIPKDTTLSYPAGGSNLMMFKGHTDAEEAAGWDFLKYMTNVENSLKWAAGTGYLPTRVSETV